MVKLKDNKYIFSPISRKPSFDIFEDKSKGVGIIRVYRKSGEGFVEYYNEDGSDIKPTQLLKEDYIFSAIGSPGDVDPFVHLTVVRVGQLMSQRANETTGEYVVIFDVVDVDDKTDMDDQFRQNYPPQIQYRDIMKSMIRQIRDLWNNREDE
jgi:hypothetical protein